MPRNIHNLYRFTRKTVGDLGGKTRIILNTKTEQRIVIELSDRPGWSTPNHISAKCVHNSAGYWVNMELWPGERGLQAFNISTDAAAYAMWETLQSFLLAEGFLEPDPTYVGDQP